MIIGIGTDIVEVERFAHWHTFSHKQLSRIFSAQEIEYCLSVTTQSAQRFAVRFAAREACYKALSTYLPAKIPFLTFCRVVTVEKQINSSPQLVINWQLLGVTEQQTENFLIWLSLSHTKSYATVMVIVEKINDE